MKSTLKSATLVISFLALLSACGSKSSSSPTPPPSSTVEWTWVSGSNTMRQAGSYWTQGTAASSNVPGARGYAVSWLDSSGKLWLFGGYGLDSAGNSGYLNDLWKYDRQPLNGPGSSAVTPKIRRGLMGPRARPIRQTFQGPDPGPYPGWIPVASSGSSGDSAMIRPALPAISMTFGSLTRQPLSGPGSPAVIP